MEYQEIKNKKIDSVFKFLLKIGGVWTIILFGSGSIYIVVNLSDQKDAFFSPSFITLPVVCSVSFFYLIFYLSSKSFANMDIFAKFFSYIFLAIFYLMFFLTTLMLFSFFTNAQL